MCVERWFPERQLNRYRGHWASKTNRMSAAHGAGLTHPTLSCRSCLRKQTFPELRCTAQLGTLRWPSVTAVRMRGGVHATSGRNGHRSELRGQAEPMVARYGPRSTAQACVLALLDDR